MWQYYVLMALVVVSLVAGLASNNKLAEVKSLSTGQVIISLVVGSLMTWLIWSFLSVNWMWLSIGLMALSFVNLARMTFYCAILRKTVADKTSYGTFICLVQGVAYTIFYFKYVV